MDKQTWLKKSQEAEIKKRGKVIQDFFTQEESVDKEMARKIHQYMRWSIKKTVSTKEKIAVKEPYYRAQKGKAESFSTEESFFIKNLYFSCKRIPEGGTIIIEAWKIVKKNGWFVIYYTPDIETSVEVTNICNDSEESLLMSWVTFIMIMK